MAPIHLYRVTCGALSITWYATSSCDAIGRAVEFYGLQGATAERLD